MALFKLVGSRHMQSFRLPNPVFTFDEHEAVYPESGFMDKFDYTCFEHLVHFFHKGFF